jgi:ABC-2 type transport system permease protein
VNALLKQCQFEAVRALRNRQFIFFSVLMPLIFYFIFVKVNGGNMQVEGTAWKAYFLMSMAAFSVVGSSMFGLAGRVAFERTQGWLRLVQTTPLPHYAYVIGKCLSQLMVGLVSVVVLFLVGAVSQGVDLSVGQWGISLLWLVLGSLPFVAIGILVGVLFSTEATYLVCNILNMGLGILGGLWWPITIMPKVMQHIVYATPTYRFAHVTWQVIGGKSIPVEDVAILLGYLAVLVALTLWVLRRKQVQDA